MYEKFGKVERSLYRVLWRLSRRFDSNPIAKLLIHRQVVYNSTTNIEIGYFNVLLTKILGNRQLFLPKNAPKFVNVLRNEARTPSLASASLKQRTDAGFGVIKKLSGVWKSYTSINLPAIQWIADATAKSLTTLPTFAETEVPQQGLLLLAHPLVSGPLHRSVILLLEHSEKGSYGLVVNRPTSHNLSTAVKNLPQELQTSFGSVNVAFGGMVRRIQFLHTVTACGGAAVPFSTTPLFAGGLVTRSLAVIKKQPEKLNDFQFFVGCCCWQSGQLATEIDAGYWIVAQSQPDRLLELLRINTPPPSNEDMEEGEDNSMIDAKSVNPLRARNSEQKGARTTKYRNGEEAEQIIDVYQLALQSLGEPLSVMARLPHWIDASFVESCDL